MRRFLSIFVLSFGILCFQPDVLALRVDRAPYRYPYKDPYLATTTLSIAKGRDVLLADDDVSRKSLEITIIDNRDNTYLLEGKGKLRFRFYQQIGSAPLIFIIPGLGSPAASGSAPYLAEVLVDQGFHVLILPSPFNWNFALAASRSGLPGITQEDSEDLYSAMQLILQHIKIHYGARVGGTGLIGLSDGALYGAYIGKIDTEKRKIGILRYLLVNPPVDLFKGIAIIDQMAELGRKFGTQQRKRIEAYGVGVATQASEMASGVHDPFNDPAYFAGWDKRFRLSEEQMQYLIGRALQLPIGDVIYVRELVHPEGVLKTAISYAHRTERFYEAHSYGIRDYVRLFLIPGLEQRRRSQTINGVWKIGLSLRDIESTLVGNKNIFVMHNQDDFLVSIEDLDYLERLLGDRAKIYPYGGHMGNIWYWQNRNDIVSIFASLQRANESEPIEGIVRAGRPRSGLRPSGSGLPSWRSWANVPPRH